MNFIKQIEEDIKIIQSDYSKFDHNLDKDEYAFNYWILSKLYNVDEEIIRSLITEYKDDAIDCYLHFEDSKEIYIIQNKYYHNTKVDMNYVQKEFLLKPLDTLYYDNYKRSEELQKIFNKSKKDPEYQIYFHMYVSNNIMDTKVIEHFKRFSLDVNHKYPDLKARVTGKIFYIDDIEDLYLGGRIEERKNFKFDFLTINKGTVLNINNEEYKLPNLTNAKYVLTPVKQLYEIVKKSKKENYPLFSSNIREYLGRKGINKKIAETLENPKDRENFFYYNNGITVICDSIVHKQVNDKKFNRAFTVNQPQIVNGCQTVNTIFQVLDNYSDNEVESEFKNVYVMVKILELDDNNEENRILYENIVRYNNSQNKIDEKYFEAVQSEYLNIQDDFEKRGFLLLVKQSDKETFRNKYKKSYELMRLKAEKYTSLYGISINNISDLEIPLDKLLQVVLAFVVGGYEAYSKKSSILKPENEINTSIYEYVKSVTRNQLLNLYLFYLKSEIEKKSSHDGRTPVPYYVIGFMGKDLRDNDIKEYKALDKLNSSKELIEAVYGVYKMIARRYGQKIIKDDFDYQKMIKSRINDEVYYEAKKMVISDSYIDDRDKYELYLWFIKKEEHN